MIKELKQRKIKSKFVYDVSSLLYYHVLIRQGPGKGEKLLINSFPKSGTHLLTNLLTYLPEYKFSGVHIRTYKVNKLARKAEENNKFEVDKTRLEDYFRLLKTGQYMSAHLPYDENIVFQAMEKKVRILALIRDPRDVVVSEANYIMNLKRHYLHDYLGKDISLDGIVRRLIDGFEYGSGYVHLPLKYRLDKYLGWLNDKRVFSCKYEDFITSNKGGDDDLAIKNIERILDFINRNDASALEILERAKGKPSATLRKGGAGNWKTELNGKTVNYMEEELEGSLNELGYI